MLFWDLGQSFDSNVTLFHYELSPRKGETVLFVGDLSYADNYPNHDNMRHKEGLREERDINAGRAAIARVEAGAMGVNVSECMVIMGKGREMGRNVVVEKAKAHGAVTMLVYGKGEKGTRVWEAACD
ncbi:hypothetical protein VIGAN_11164400 [Vigna angularis var. angularis]|uniref:Uncharacterized protein n=1 Tax=Vigna angularis var. angularis TaxID=157739 RepID=A0A0S3TAX6_PHAAN|nr:hypothetical protein VIGAN_11164400 [Vigna angularis var. angularis]